MFAVSAIRIDPEDPLQGPLVQPTNADPDEALAVRMTVDPCAMFAVHPFVEPLAQLIPAGCEVMLPCPDPLRVI